MTWIAAVEAGKQYNLPPGAVFEIISGYRKKKPVEGLLRESEALDYSRQDVFRHNLLIMLDEKKGDELDTPPQHDKRCPIHKED